MVWSLTLILKDTGNYGKLGGRGWYHVFNFNFMLGLWRQMKICKDSEHVIIHCKVAKKRSQGPESYKIDKQIEM